MTKQLIDRDEVMKILEGIAKKSMASFGRPDIYPSWIENAKKEILSLRVTK